jgi:GTP diphosphokinase / guanosine-3',5'-bis(diphosphate) 3'-diphosphatase
MNHLTLLKTMSYSAEAHKHQTRKSGGAYINHPIRVAESLAKAGVEDSLPLQIALLHDTIEDTEVTYEDLEREFGKEVADGVVELSDDKSLDKAERKALTITHAPHLSRASALVKIADNCDNCNGILGDHPPQGWTQERIEAYGDWARQVAEAAYKALKTDASREIAQRLARASLLPTNLEG